MTIPRPAPSGASFLAKSRLLSKGPAGPTKFAALLDRSPTKPTAALPEGAPRGVVPAAKERAPREADARPPEPQARTKARRVERELERDPTELACFRPPPSVLSPPPALAAPPTTTPPRAELARLVDQLVTRMRVGRSREGAVLELRVSVGARETELRFVETAHGVELHTDADPTLREAIARELAARGVALEVA